MYAYLKLLSNAEMITFCVCLHTHINAETQNEYVPLHTQLSK